VIFQICYFPFIVSSNRWSVSAPVFGDVVKPLLGLLRRWFSQVQMQACCGYYQFMVLPRFWQQATFAPELNFII
jgi:hypothetical protein